VDGQRYLPGQRHEQLLRGGLYCELFIESVDEWVPAVIMTRREVAIPHTTIALKAFEVRYASPSLSPDADRARGVEGSRSAAAVGATAGSAGSVTGAESTVVPSVQYESESDVRSDRIRLLLDEEGNVIDSRGEVLIPAAEYDETAAAAAAARAAPVVVESTGKLSLSCTVISMAKLSSCIINLYNSHGAVIAADRDSFI
jgi:hypothetical protein